MSFVSHKWYAVSCSIILHRWSLSSHLSLREVVRSASVLVLVANEVRGAAQCTLLPVRYDDVRLVDFLILDIRA